MSKVPATPYMPPIGTNVLVVNQGSIRIARVVLTSKRRCTIEWVNSVRKMQRVVTVVKSLKEWMGDPNARAITIASLPVDASMLVDKRYSKVTKSYITPTIESHLPKEMAMTIADLDRIYRPTVSTWENLILLEVVRLGSSNRRNSGRWTTGTKTHLVRTSYVIGFVDDAVAERNSNMETDGPPTLGTRYYRMREYERANFVHPWYQEAEPVVFSSRPFCYGNGQHAGAPSERATEVTCTKCAKHLA